MSEQQTPIPAPILDALTKAAEQDVAAAAADKEAAALDRRIADLEGQLAAMKTAYSALGKAATDAVEHAKDYRAMAYGRAGHRGITEESMVEADKAAQVAAQQPAPEPPAEPFVRDRAESGRTAWMPEPPDTRQWEYGTCMHCEQRISREMLPGARWSHMTGVDCSPGDPISPHAEPKVSEP